jgi:hypothetical protein
MNKLKSSDLSKILAFLNDINIKQGNIKGGLQAKRKTLIDGGASPSIISAIDQEITDVTTSLSDVNMQIVNYGAIGILNTLISTDINNAMSKIATTNDKVSEALDKIEEVKRKLEYISLFFQLAGAIIGVANTSSPAAIKNLVGQIDILYDTDFDPG